MSADGAFPDMPHLPPLPNLRPENATAMEIVRQVESIVRSARGSIHQVECCARPGEQLVQIRSAVVDIRRVTFVLQTLRSRVDGFDEWYEPIQERMRADPLMRYFVELRNAIEKRGLPSPVAELYRLDTGDTIADVACFEDEHGLAVSGAARPDSGVPSGKLEVPHGLRNFRLPDPPTSHRGAQLTDLRFTALAEMAIDLLETEVVIPARSRFCPT